MMGAGKSTLARLIADRLGRKVSETDQVVEDLAGRPIPQIFNHDGEETFRDLERRAVAEVARHHDRVIALGGGAVLDRVNVDRLRESAALVYLEAPAAVLAERLAATGGDERPLLDGADDLRERVTELLARRAPRYAAVADHTVDAFGTPEEVAEAVLLWAREEPDVLGPDEADRLSP